MLNFFLMTSLTKIAIAIAGGSTTSSSIVVFIVIFIFTRRLSALTEKDNHGQDHHFGHDAQEGVQGRVLVLDSDQGLGGRVQGLGRAALGQGCHAPVDGPVSRGHVFNLESRVSAKVLDADVRVKLFAGGCRVLEQDSLGIGLALLDLVPGELQLAIVVSIGPGSKQVIETQGLLLLGSQLTEACKTTPSRPRPPQSWTFPRP